MREILFRGKRIDNGKWVVGGCYASDGGKRYIITYGVVIHECPGDGPDIYDDFSTIEIDPETVGQYTGLTDKNGKKIFEGDILEQVLEDDDCVIRAFIVWHGSGWAFKEKRFSPDLILSCSECEPYEIIGNIHDNFELLDNSELLEDKL